ncbi:hypothetical protein ERJ75_001653300 [Trypanosoma vivax]|nr:hypothetical protein ERJ75_001653300 [Trypanosoma vivax]
MCTPGTGGLVELMLDIEKAVRTTSKLRDKINATERYANATVSAFMGVGNESAYGDAEALEVKVAAAPLPPAFTRYGQIITSLKLLHASV